MGSFFPALQTQLPAQALGQTVGAVSAYEQLSDIRNRRQAQAEAAQRQALVQQLQGRAALGDQQALQGLLQASPETGLDLIKRHQEFQQGRQGLQQGAVDLQTSQAQLGREQLQTQAAQRGDALRKAAAARRAIQTVRQNPNDPQIYQRVRAGLEAQGIARPGSLPETPPTIEQLDDFETQINISEQLLSDPAKAEELKGELADIQAVYGLDSEEGQQLADRLVRSRIAEREARTAKALREDREAIAQAPPGLTAIQGRIPTKEEAKEARRVVSGVAPVISTIQKLQGIVERVGFQPITTDDAAEAKALAALAQLQLKDALELGALDAGSERFLQRLLPKDPTQFRQGIVGRTLSRIDDELKTRLRIQSRARGFDVNIDEVLGRGGSRTLTSGAIDPRMERAIQQRLQAEGFDPRQIDKAIGNLKQSVGGGGQEVGENGQQTGGRERSTAPGIRQMDNALQQLALEDPPSFVQQRLEQGVDRAEVVRELQALRGRQGGDASAPARREPAPQTQAPESGGSPRASAPADVQPTSPLTIPSIQQRVANLPFVRHILENSGELSEDQSLDVIRRTVEGQDLVRAVEDVARRRR